MPSTTTDDNDHDECVDCWHPCGPIVRKVVRELHVPRETAVAALEAAGINVGAEG